MKLLIFIESIQTFLDKSEGSLGQYKQQIDKLNDELTELQGQLAQSKHEKVCPPDIKRQ